MSPLIRAEEWVTSSSALRRLGRVSELLAARPTTFGLAYEPTTATTGLLPGVTLTNYNSPATSGSVDLVPGETIINKHIYGDIRHPGGATVTILNCFIHGSPHTHGSATGAVQCYNSRTSGVIVLWDCRIEPQNPINRDGIAGHKYEAYRCYVTGSLDGFGSLTTLAVNSGRVDVKLMGNMVEKMVYRFPDTYNGSTSPPTGDSAHDDGTHNDCWQHQGGTHAEVVGNAFWGTAYALAGTGTNPERAWLLNENNGAGAQRDPGWNNGACILVQQNTDAPVDSTVSVRENWLHGSPTQGNFNDSDAHFEYKSNRHYYAGLAFNANPPPTWNRVATRVENEAASNMPGFLPVNVDNRWVDGPYAGQLLAAPRANGILFDA